jgi:hypothetical protein
MSAGCVPAAPAASVWAPLPGVAALALSAVRSAVSVHFWSISLAHSADPCSIYGGPPWLVAALPGPYATKATRGGVARSLKTSKPHRVQKPASSPCIRSRPADALARLLSSPPFHEITESRHRILNPLNDRSSTTWPDTRITAGTRQLDLACGKGELLATWSSRYGLHGVGVGISKVFLEAARAPGRRVGTSAAVSAFVEADTAPCTRCTTSCPVAAQRRSAAASPARWS